MKITTTLTRLAIITALIGTLVHCSGGGGGGSGSKLDQNACGVLGLNTKIITGTPCDPTHSPVVELDINFADGSEGVCSGTLLTPQYVLTAAHCFAQKTIAVQAGNGTISSFGEIIYLHPNFSIDKTTKVPQRDAAILKLRTPLALPTMPILTSEPTAEGDVIAIFGYGKDENGGLRVLRSGEMRVASLDQDHLFAQFDGEGSNTCNGDSGGPAFGQTKSGAWGLVGITSAGTNTSCAIGDNSIFANLADSDILSFIQSTVTGLGTI